MTERGALDKVVRVIGYGVGPIGAETLRQALRTPWVQVVGAIDIDPAKAGHDLGEVLGLDRALGVPVSADAGACLAQTPADIIIHCAGSRLPAVRAHLAACIAAGLRVVSSAEELLFPTLRHPEIARDLDRMAREGGVALLGTGVNPGFVMDLLPLVCTGVCRDVRRIGVERVVDAATRRLPLQRKVGAGMTPQAFREQVEAGRLGHVGLVESLAFVADALGWAIGDIEESIDPVVAEAEVQTAYLRVAKGEVAGLHHVARASAPGRGEIALDLRMYVGARDPHDAIRIEGTPPLDLLIRGGTAGDQATVAALINAIPRVLAAPPGLHTLKDLPVPRMAG